MLAVAFATASIVSGPSSWTRRSWSRRGSRGDEVERLGWWEPDRW